ncbi:MAG: glycosyltransferase [Kiritimatiellia bacterium]
MRKKLGVDEILQGLTAESLGHWCEQASDLHLIWSSRPEGTEYFLPVLRRKLPGVPVVYDTHDLHHIREYRQARYLRNAGLLQASLRRKQQECRLAKAVDRVVMVSDHEKHILQALIPEARLSTLAWFQQEYKEIPGWASRSGLLFVGGFFNGASANTESICWFMDEVWPRIQKEKPEMLLWLVGGDVPEWLQKRESETVRIPGRVKDLTSIINRVRVSLAPLQIGAGIKGKVMESWAMGLPVVGTGIAAEGFPEEGRHAMKVEDDPRKFAEAVLEVHEQEAEWSRMSGAGKEVVRMFYSRERVSKQLNEVIKMCRREGADV